MKQHVGISTIEYLEEVKKLLLDTSTINKIIGIQNIPEGFPTISTPDQTSISIFFANAELEIQDNSLTFQTRLDAKEKILGFLPIFTEKGNMRDFNYTLVRKDIVSIEQYTWDGFETYPGQFWGNQKIKPVSWIKIKTLHEDESKEFLISSEVLPGIHSKEYIYNEEIFSNLTNWLNNSAKNGTN